MFKNRYILIRNLALLFIVGNLMYWIFPFPPVVWRLAIVLLSLYVIFFEGGIKTKFEKTVVIFAGVNLLYFFLSFGSIVPSTTQIGNTLCALLTLSLFACCGEKGVMTDKFFTVVSIILLLASIAAYYHAQITAWIQYGLQEGTDITNNATSAFLMLLPMLFLIKKDWLKMVFLVFSLFFLIMGAKRGNILAAIIPMGLFVWYMLKDSRHSVGKTFVVVLSVVIVGYMAYNWFSTNDYLMYRLEQTAEGDSSERDLIYANAWHTWWDSDNFINQLFGYGYDATIHVPSMEGSRAHNDWLEILVDFGLFGIVFYVSVFLTFWRHIRGTRNLNIRLILLSAFFIWLFKSAYSMGFTENNMSLLMLSLGTAIGWTRNKRVVTVKR